MPKIRVYPSELKGTLALPGSKSFTHRALILSALSKPGSEIINPLISKDTMATKTILEQMGAKFTPIKNGYRAVQPACKSVKLGDCKNSGTTLRLLTAVSALFNRKSTLTGDASLRKRPIAPLLSALNSLGIQTSSDNDYPPVTVTGSSFSGNLHCNVSGNISSQFISALLILGSRINGTISIKVTDTMVSKPYLDLTIAMLSEIGIKIKSNGRTFIVHGSPLFQPHTWNTPSDISSASPFIVAASCSLNSQISTHLAGLNYPQADTKIIDILIGVNAKIIKRESKIVISGNSLKPITADLKACPDIFPILAVACAKINGTSKLFGASHLKHKESNRIATVVEMLKKQGVTVEELPDGCVIHGTGTIQGGKDVQTHEDHRIEMSAVICGILAENPITISNPYSVDVSFPEFYSELRKLGARIEAKN